MLAQARLNPLVDVQFVVALLACWAVPLGLVALVLSVPVTLAALLALP